MKQPKEYKLSAQLAYETYCKTVRDCDGKLNLIPWSTLDLDTKDRWFKVSEAVINNFKLAIGL